MDDNKLYELYVVQKKSTKDIGKMTNISYSTIRRRLLKIGCMRGQKEARELAKWKMGLHLKGKKRQFTQEWKENMKKGAIRRWQNERKGICLKPNGYYEITIGKNKGRTLHDVIMEINIGRKLKPDEVVHHVNEIRTDNRIENLQLMTRSEHCSLHAKINHKLRNRNKKGQFS